MTADIGQTGGIVALGKTLGRDFLDHLRRYRFALRQSENESSRSSQDTVTGGGTQQGQKGLSGSIFIPQITQGAEEQHVFVDSIQFAQAAEGFLAGGGSIFEEDVVLGNGRAEFFITGGAGAGSQKQPQFFEHDGAAAMGTDGVVEKAVNER